MKFIRFRGFFFTEKLFPTLFRPVLSLVHYAQGLPLSPVIFFLAFSKTGVYNVSVII